MSVTFPEFSAFNTAFALFKSLYDSGKLMSAEYYETQLIAHGVRMIKPFPYWISKQQFMRLKKDARYRGRNANASIIDTKVRNDLSRIAFQAVVDACAYETRQSAMFAELVRIGGHDHPVVSVAAVFMKLVRYACIEVCNTSVMYDIHALRHGVELEERDPQLVSEMEDFITREFDFCGIDTPTDVPNDEADMIVPSTLRATAVDRDGAVSNVISGANSGSDSIFASDSDAVADLLSSIFSIALSETPTPYIILGGPRETWYPSSLIADSASRSVFSRQTKRPTFSDLPRENKRRPGVANNRAL